LFIKYLQVSQLQFSCLLFWHVQATLTRVPELPSTCVTELPSCIQHSWSNHASDYFNGLLPQDITMNLLVWSLLPRLLLLLTRSEDKTAHKLYGCSWNESKLRLIHWIVNNMFTLLFTIMLMFITFVHVCASSPTLLFVVSYNTRQLSSVISQ